MPELINISQTNVGQWLSFYSGMILTSDQRKIYNKQRYFLVVTRSSQFMDEGSCMLVDQEGLFCHFCPRMNVINDISLAQCTEISAHSEKEMLAEIGTQGLLTAYEAAEKYLVEVRSKIERFALCVSTLNPRVIAKIKETYTNNSQADLDVSADVQVSMPSIIKPSESPPKAVNVSFAHTPDLSFFSSEEALGVAEPHKKVKKHKCILL